MGDGHRDHGSATVEFAVILPAIVLVLAAVLGAGDWAIQQSRAEAAAATAARVAIVDTDAVARASARRVARASVTTTIAHDGAWVTVTVRGPKVWGLPVRATAVAREQP